MKTPYTLISQATGVPVEAIYNSRCKISKTLTRHGVNPKLVALLSNLKVAVTPAEIDMVYADRTILSCMTGYKLGRFFYENGISVLHSADFRVLISQDMKGISPRAYGTKGEATLELIRHLFTGVPGKQWCEVERDVVTPKMVGTELVLVNEGKTKVTLPVLRHIPGEPFPYIDWEYVQEESIDPYQYTDRDLSDLVLTEDMI